MHKEVIVFLKCVSPQQVFYLKKTMTTDEGARNNGESPAAAVAERGEDVTSKKDRGVLKVRP